ncbi:hypothetical protein LVJ94_26035 [Pendulispora rubella]|uniref:DUF4240 domain-containing protein n=1 Tax=Pendulispora rubella TaxID=2741070 RepID=A0ABZ2LIV4_9BACT
MNLDDPSFWQAVEELRELAVNGAELSELLKLAKARAGKGKPVLACAIFYRAFDLPMQVVTSLGAWTGFEEQFGNPGRTAEELDEEYGDLIRAHAQRLARD